MSQQPERPSNAHLDVEERTDEPTADYATEEYPPQPFFHDDNLEPDAIAVYQVTAPPIAGSDISWSAMTETVTDRNAVRLSGRDDRRKRLVVRNNNAAGGNDVLLGTESTLSSAHGYMAYTLQPQQEVEFLHNAGVWARCKSTESADVTVLNEFALDDR